MKKFTNVKGYPLLPFKIDLKLKISVFLFLVILINAHASTYSQNTKISLDLEDVSVGEVLKKIESLSEFDFLYNVNEVDFERKLSIKANKKKISKILHQLFVDTNISYSVIDRQIILKKRTNDTLQNVPVEETSQQNEITGVVKDSDGNVMPGVSIVIEGTIRGTVTDFDGAYKVMASVGEVLVFSHIGMKTVKVTVGDSNAIDVIMEADAASLDEVVVVGYGKQKRANLTGALTQINDEVIAGRPITSGSQALQGVVPGVFVTQGYSAPGRDETRIRIRGLSLQLAGGSNNPLVLIDGVQGSLNDINPSDIETITVLKDAASTAIYGSQAGNGVVLVTTKRGNNEKVSVEYDTYAGFQRATTLPNMISNSAQYMELFNVGMVNAGRAPTYPQATIDAYRNNPDLPNTNWVDLVYNDAQIQQHTIKLSGGNEAARVFFSSSYLSQEGIQTGTNFDRFNFRLNADTKVSDKFSLGVNLSGSNSKRHDSGGDLTAVYLLAMSANPMTEHVISDDGRYSYPRLNGGSANGFGTELSNDNPFGWLDNRRYDTTNKNFNGAIFGELEITEGLKLKGQASYRLNNSTTKRFEEGYQTFSRNVTTDASGAVVWNNDVPENTDDLQLRNVLRYPNNRLYRYVTETEQYNMFAHLDYHKEFGEHVIDALLGAQQEWITGYGVLAYANGDFASGLEEFSMASSDVEDQWVSRSTAYVPSEWVLQSQFARVNYRFKDRYLFEANIRRDVSSKFHPDNREAYFPSFSAGWRISEEDFMESVDFVDNLKLRTSWGQSGEQRGISSYAYISSISNNGEYIFGDGTATTGGKSINTLADENVQWQTNEQYDIGIEAGFFNGKLSVEADYFVKDNKDQLAREQLVSLAGVGAPIGNPFSVRNKGWEVSLNHKNKVGKFEYNVGVNFSAVKNEVLELKQDTIYASVYTITAEGLPIRSYWLYEFEKIVQTQAEADALNAGAPDGTYHRGGASLLKAGDIKYRDIDGDGHITSKDKSVQGKSYPGLTFGFNVSAKYKNFDMSILAQGVLDYDIMMEGWGYYPLIQGSMTDYVLDMWTPENPSTTKPRLVAHTGGANNNNRPRLNPSTFSMFNGSYLRFKNIQLGYTIPSSTTDKLKLSSVRVYLNAQNAFTISNYLDGFDPERLSVGDPSSANARVTQYPQAKTFSVGLNVKF